MNDDRIDVLLADWARRPVVDADAADRAVAALTAQLPPQAVPPRRRWIAVGGLGLAATLAATLLLRPANVTTAPIADVGPTTAAVEVAQVTEADLEAWSLMFATTPEEEQLI